MTPHAGPWFVGAWRRRSITVPGSEPTEPCEAWWIQTGHHFVDVRVANPGEENNGLPYSQTRAFAGRFEVADGEVRWHLDLDTAGLAPRTDRAPAVGLYLSRNDPTVMIEDAPGRFREVWEQRAAAGPSTSTVGGGEISVQVGAIAATLRLVGSGCFARVWSESTGTLAVIDSPAGRAA